MSIRFHEFQQSLHAQNQCAVCGDLEERHFPEFTCIGAPWLYAISETNREGVESWHDGEQCVFADRESAQEEVDLLNDGYPEGEFPFKVVPLYRA